MHVAPIKLNKAREGPNPAAPPRNKRALYGRNGGLPNEFIHQAAGREVVEHEPLVAPGLYRSAASCPYRQTILDLPAPSVRPGALSLR